MKRGWALWLILCLMISLIPLAQADEISFTGTISGGSLHMRKEPKPSAKVVNTYKSGTEVQILENDGTWCKVKVGNKTGYMMAQYLDIKANYPHIGWGRATRREALLNIYEKPDLNSSIIFKAMDEMNVELVEKKNGWYKIRFSDAFGYLPEAMITPLSGDFALGFSQNDGISSVRASDLYSAVREVGSPRTMNRDEGDFTYTVAWPDVGIAEANQLMGTWVQDMLNRFEADYRSYYEGKKAHCRIEYQSLQIDDRYQSILLAAEYTVDGLRVDHACTLNLDTKTGTVLSADQLFNATDKTLFSLETGIAQLMNADTDGYTGKAASAMLDHILITRDGLAVYLPAGVYLPVSMGIQRIMIPWKQIATESALESEIVSQYIRKIDPSKPMIALTFDDGPSDQTTRILDVLDQYGGKATFCVQGMNVEKYADVVRRAVAEGHEIASHTWNHKRLTEVSASTVRSQLERTNAIVSEVTGGYQVKVLRPPYGSVNKTVRNICADLDMVIAHWKVDTLDWETRSTSKTYRAIIKGAENGVIVLCHDLYSSTASAIEKAVPELVEKGYQLVTVSELLSFHKDGAKPGTVYAFLAPENIRTE